MNRKPTHQFGALIFHVLPFLHEYKKTTKKEHIPSPNKEKERIDVHLSNSITIGCTVIQDVASEINPMNNPNLATFLPLGTCGQSSE